MKVRIVPRLVLTLLLLELLVLASISMLRADQPFGSALGEETEDFTVVVLPDTQLYSHFYPLIFDNQTQWIVKNVEDMNILFVTHEGDIVEYWTILDNWDNANSSMSKLDDYVLWGVLPGNHDILLNRTNYDNYFGCDRFGDKSWYAGSYPTDSNTNNYQMFSVGGDDYLIFHLQYNPTDEVLAWANTTIGNYPKRRVIVTTHDYISGDGSNQRSTIGEEIWQKFVKHHTDQIFLVLCGHSIEEERRVDTVNGHVVYQLLANYQARDKGGNGWLRILKFVPEEDKIYVKTYSPYLDSYETDSNSEFTLDYDMADPATGGLVALVPYLGLAIIVAVAAAIVLYVKKRKK